MSDRGRIQALTTLVQSAGAGGYTLPADVTEAHNVWQKLRQVEIPPPSQFSAEDAAGRIVHAAAAGEPFDPIKVCRDFHKAGDERRLYDEALRVMAQAVDQAANVATGAASDATERIITEHLRPAHDDVMEKARETAALLKPYTDGSYRLNLQGIVAATSTKVRAAYLALPGLLERRRLLWQARSKANTVGERKAEHDDGGLFALFERPMTFHPQWKPPARVPQLPVPEDETARLLWLASDEVTAAKPWFPTLDEQDAAWWAQFGEQVTRAATNRHNARAMAAQAAGTERPEGTETAIPSPASPPQRRVALAGRLFGSTAGGVPVNGGAVEK